VTSNTMQIDASDTTPARSNAFFRGFIEGAAGLFDIFCIGASKRRRGTPEDDARELRGDVEQIAQDFHVVLSGIDANPKK
jgi:hypothetical protein